jgi:uncharacterized Zn finger protein
LVAFSLAHSAAAIPGRARTYARQGQVVGVSIEDESAQAQIQGTDVRPYQVGLRRVAPHNFTAECTCPYGCTPRAWCKHAVALAYVVAELVDTDGASAARWTGSLDSDAPLQVSMPVAPELLARLTAPRPHFSARDVLARAAEVVPPPPV